MASSDVELCNLALSYLGVDARIQSLTEDSIEARYCKAQYATTRDTLLRSHAWRWATKYATLADLGDPPTHWDYRYQYPNDCLRALEIVTESETDDPIAFEVAAGDSLDTKVILTDQYQAELKYIARITNPTVFDPSFTNALAWLLAVNLCQPVTGDNTKYDICVQSYQQAVAAAFGQDANEGHRDYHREADWISGRL